MKAIDVDKQVRLSLAKTMELVLSGVRFRLFRAAVTVAIISLAVAFLMTMLSESVVARKVAEAIEVQTQPRRLFTFWVGRLGEPTTPAHLTDQLAAITPGGDRWEEFGVWGGLAAARLEQLADMARRQKVYDVFFEDLEEGDLRALLGRHRGLAIYDYLAEGEAFERFKGGLPQVGRSFPEATLEKFRAFLDAWGGIQGDRQAILAGHRGATEQVNTEMLEARRLEAVLADGDETLRQFLLKQGFELPAEEFAELRRQAAGEGGDKSDGLVFWSSWLTSPLTTKQLRQRLAELPSESPRRREMKRWANLDDEQITHLSKLTRQEAAYLGYFAGLEEADRRKLIGQADGEGIFEALAAEGGLARLEAELPNIQRPLPGEGVQELRTFLKAWQERRPHRNAILTGHRLATERVAAELLANRSVDHILAHADETLPQRLAAYGYRMPAEAVEVVREQAALSIDAKKVSDMLAAPMVRQSLATRVRLDKAADASSQILFEQVRSVRGAQWFVDDLARIRRRIVEQVDQAKEAISDQERQMLEVSRSYVTQFDLPAERLAVVAQYRLKDNNLTQVQAKVAEAAGAGYKGFSPRTMALLTVSFLVCIVGIANAMLMSVTERFREIATMKCLGATDGFIMVNFVLESCMQGVAGGVIGAALGFLLGVGRSTVMYGRLALTQLPVGDIVASAGISFVLGLIVSALAAVYPAFVAARLAPMEAMRIE